MLNKPHLDMIETTSQLLAGEKFPADQQCELIFGPNSKVCPFTVTVSIFGQEVDQVSEWNDTRSATKYLYATHTFYK